MQTEALKFWFYALSVSVALDLYELLFVYSDSASSQSDHPTNQKEATSTIVEKTGDKGVANEPPQSKARHAKSAKRRAVYRQLAIDSCDLLIPSAAVGWLQLDPVTVGVAGTVSALLGGSDVWQRVNA
ncbi:uncharacterized protein Z519_03849 [Cladophialophora bantiana CBS 173.52]|uniref:Uncharacterized protein n=1 Tax=Cladophialophora bantiana (strain ATCC 10958 / CBS 173.52 / CDC B-1940 / NIH 8579) TaxID=1442370 RepID=A0A0D2HWF6_CLAB1|nr:uncharacterized protein Z519_03849 [Cladophialophora bantiana CBS 173.52]KIW95265.1 hypothetical protein Z519_03849 [Cladophialophora bantiana CBS 173.52]